MRYVCEFRMGDEEKKEPISRKSFFDCSERHQRRLVQAKRAKLEQDETRVSSGASAPPYEDCHDQGPSQSTVPAQLHESESTSVNAEHLHKDFEELSQELQDTSITSKQTSIAESYKEYESDYEPEEDDSEECNQSANFLKYQDTELLKEELRAWHCGNKCTQTATTELLQILRSEVRFPDLPKRCETLVKTPTGKVEIREVTPGIYWHCGIEKNLSLLHEDIKNNLKIGDTIRITVGIDGIPMAKSSGSQFYPILGLIDELSEVFVIGCYHGNHKPKDFNDFLKDFVKEMSHLIANGFECEGTSYKIEFHKLICDAPAKSAVL